MTCSVKGCGSVRRLCDENISFHRFPREPDNIQKAWVNALGLNPSLWTWTRAKYVCSKHFRVEDYIQPHVLKSDAVPSLCLHISVSNIRGHDSRGHLEVTGSSTLSVESIGEKNISISTSSSSSGRMPKRRKHANIDSSSTDKSTDSSSKRRRVQLVKKLHNYSISPSKLKNKCVKL